MSTIPTDSTQTGEILYCVQKLLNLLDTSSPLAVSDAVSELTGSELVISVGLANLIAEVYFDDKVPVDLEVGRPNWAQGSDLVFGQPWKGSAH